MIQVLTEPRGASLHPLTVGNRASLSESGCELSFPPFLQWNTQGINIIVKRPTSAREGMPFCCVHFLSLLRVSYWVRDRSSLSSSRSLIQLPLSESWGQGLSEQSLQQPGLTADRQVPHTCPFLPSVLNALASPSLSYTILFVLMGSQYGGTLGTQWHFNAAAVMFTDT